MDEKIPSPLHILLKSIIDALVDDPAKAFITEGQDEKGKYLSVRVAQADAGKIIGKQGVTAQAIRQIIRSVSRKQREDVSVIIQN